MEALRGPRPNETLNLPESSASLDHTPPRPPLGLWAGESAAGAIWRRIVFSRSRGVGDIRRLPASPSCGRS